MVKSPIHHTANEFMPNEYQIRKYAINLLDRWDYYYWYPARTKFKTQVDIFGVYDIIAFKDWMIKYIQFTTTLLASNIKSLPVAGFLPLRSPLSFTENFPNLEINTSSPVSKVLLISSKRELTTWADLVLDRPTWLYMESISSALVRVMVGCSC